MIGCSRSPPRDDVGKKTGKDNLIKNVAEDLTNMEKTESNDVFDLLISSKPRRKRKASDEAASEATDSVSNESVKNTRDTVKHNARGSKINRSESDELSTSEKTVEMLSSRSSKPTSASSSVSHQKKTIFRSRNKILSQESSEPDQFPSLDEFSRVPPLPTPPDSVKTTSPLSSAPISQEITQPASRSRNKFFKSKNLAPVSSAPSTSVKTTSTDLYPSPSSSSYHSNSSSSAASKTSTYASDEIKSSSVVPSASPPFSGPSPTDRSYFPARIATPVKETSVKTTAAKPVKKSIFKVNMSDWSSQIYTNL